MTRRARRLLALLALGLAGCAGLRGTAAQPAPCWPHFPYTQGWLGGDAAYSVPLEDGRILWLFGDTFVGVEGQTTRERSHFIHNTVGISECGRDGRFRIRYAWGRRPDGTPRDFLQRPGGAGWWWIFDGFLHEGDLYLGLLEVERADPSGPLAMPFRFTGAALARIARPDRDPASWRAQVLPLSRGGVALPLASLVVHGDHLYLFGFLDRGEGRHPRILSRLPLDRLGGPDLSGALETWAGDGVWLRGLDADRAAPVMEDNATEMNVHWSEPLGRWLAVYSYPDVEGRFPASPPSDAVWLRSAERLEGPWSERRLLFRVPEMAEGRDPHTGCYAAKTHPELARPGSLTLTYVCNLFTGPDADPDEILGRLVGRMDLYRPVPVAVELPRD